MSPVPSVILITVDSLRVDHLGFMGYDRPTSPNLDRLAEESVVFTNVFATGPRTPESFPGILASADPLMYGGEFGLNDRHTPLAKVLSDAGYVTGGFHSNPYLSANFHYQRGFDTFHDPSDYAVHPRFAPAYRALKRLGNVAPFHLVRNLYRAIWSFRVRHDQKWEPFRRARAINRQVMAWLRRNTQSFFVWLHYMDPHLPYLPDEDRLRHFRESIPPKDEFRELMSRVRDDPDSLDSLTAEELNLCVDLYDAEIRSTDEWIGKLLARLEDQRLFDDSLLIVTADHGEEFGDHGSLSHGKRISTPQDGRAQIKLYDELIHVPMIIRFPQGKGAKREVDSLISLMDLPATIVDLLGAEQPENWLGKSFLPTILSGQSIRNHVFSGYQVHYEGRSAPIVSCRTKSWKYIHDGAFSQHELYHLTEDPGERKNVIRRYKQRAAGLQARVLDNLANFPQTVVEVRTELDETLRTRLRSLGYMVD